MNTADNSINLKDVGIAWPVEIDEDSWLNDPAHEKTVAEFKAALAYANTQTRFIEAADGVPAEALYWIWDLLSRGAERAKCEQAAAGQGTPAT